MSMNPVIPKSEKSTISQIINAIGLIMCILLIPVMIVLGTLLIKSTIHPNTPPDFMGYIPLVVGTDSMSPEFEGKDLLIVSIPSDAANLEEGTIVSYMTGGIVVTHRIVDIQEAAEGVTYITQGDTNNVADAASVYPEQIIGVYHARVEGIGDFILFMQTPMGIVLFVVLPILIIFVCLYVADQIRYRALLKEQATYPADSTTSPSAQTPDSPMTEDT